MNIADCPKCYTPLATAGEGLALCAGGKHQFRVLFSRDGSLPPAGLAAVGQLARMLAVPAALPAADSPAVARTPSRPPSSPPPDAKCKDHAEVVATRLCMVCLAPMCDTCDFSFPEGLHACPRCATDDRLEMSPQRRRRLRWSFGLAGVATMGTIGSIVAGALAPQEVTGLLAMFGAMLPSLGGLSFGLAARLRGVPTPAGVKGAIAWNAVVAGGWAVLTIVGVFIEQ